MKQAAAVRVHRQKEAAERRMRDLARVKAGRPPLKLLAKKHWLRLSFMRGRPKPTGRGSTRPTPTTRKSTSSRTSKRKQPPPSSRPRRSSASGNRNSRRPATDPTRPIPHPPNTAKSLPRSLSRRDPPTPSASNKPTTPTTPVPAGPPSSKPGSKLFNEPRATRYRTRQAGSGGASLSERPGRLLWPCFRSWCELVRMGPTLVDPGPDSLSNP
jgi:hypothetical protein